MEHFTVNNTTLKLASEDTDFKPYPRFVTITAAACAIIFSIIGLFGNIFYIFTGVHV